MVRRGERGRNRQRGMDLFDPFLDIDRTFREMERMFRAPFGDVSGDLAAATPSAAVTPFWRPAVDITEDKDKYLFHVELPGLNKDNVKINVEDGILIVKGERKMEKKSEDPDKKFTRIERQYGTFVRRFTLPRDVDKSQIKAFFKDGVLDISIPKSQEKAKESEVKIE